DALENLDLGMDHLPAAVRGFELAVEDDSRADFEPLLEIGDLVEPGERQHSAPVTRLRLEDPSTPSARVRLSDSYDLRGDGGFRSANELRDRRQRTAVLVAKRQVVEDVLDRGDAEARELIRALRPHAFHELHRRREQRERGTEVALGRSIDRVWRGGPLQALDLGETLHGTPVARVVSVER